jgi:hypothetical protein
MCSFRGSRGIVDAIAVLTNHHNFSVLKTPQIYYIIVPEVTSKMGLTARKSKCWQGCISFQRSMVASLAVSTF